MKVEETQYFEINGKTVFVKYLEEETQKNVKILDRLRQDVLDKHYELQVYGAALELKKQEIQKDLIEFINKHNSEDSVTENVEESEDQ